MIYTVEEQGIDTAKGVLKPFLANLENVLKPLLLNICLKGQWSTKGVITKMAKRLQGKGAHGKPPLRNNC